jgi:hypothetical protein
LRREKEEEEDEEKEKEKEEEEGGKEAENTEKEVLDARESAPCGGAGCQ